MPALTLHLLRLDAKTSREAFVAELGRSQTRVEIVVAARPQGWVCRPEKKDVGHLTGLYWDLMLLVKNPNADFPATLRKRVLREYKVTCGIPSKLLANYPAKNKKLIKDAPSVSLTGSLDKGERSKSSQHLEASDDLLNLADELMKEHSGPVTMLNLLHFTESGKPSYAKYGQGFAETGGRRGGDAKIVGNIIPPAAGQSDSRGDSSRPANDWWNEVAVVHYPSIMHFCDMAAGDDYQAYNTKYRLPALEDTVLLCTTEMDLERILGEQAKL